MQPFTKQIKRKAGKPCFKKADYLLINCYLSTVNWDEIYQDCKTAADYFKAFKQVLNYVIDEFVPVTRQSDKNKLPWNNDKLNRLRRVKQRKWQRYRSNRSRVKYAKFMDSAKTYREEFIKAKCNYEKKLFDGKNANNNFFFNYIRKQTTVCFIIPCLKNLDGSLATSDAEKGNLLSEYFASVFVDDNGIIPEFNVNCQTALNSLNCEIGPMIRIVKKLKINSSPGPDKITPYFLKNIIANIANPLSKLFNKCLTEGYVPEEWKIAHIIPIYKKGDAQIPSNYRPVSLTSVLCKVLERVVREQMLTYLFDHDILPRNQHGFLSKKSTVTNLLECLDEWSTNFDNKLQSDVIYLDYSKCFDTVVHDKLLYKLRRYGFCGSAFKWLESFLVNRYQRVKVGDSLSACKHVVSGVPQGTVLGPLLFLCFSSDINSVIKHSVLSMYADDTKIYRAVNCVNDCILLQRDLNSVYEWATRWQLRLNADKTKHLRIGKTRYSYVYRLNGCDIDTVTSICDIGIHIQSNLKFTIHCKNLVKRAHFI